MENKTDEEIVELVSKGNKELYAEIIQRYQTKLMRYAQYLIDDYAKASDAVQESFIKAYINLNGFNTKKKFSSWIYRIVHNEAMNLVNKHKNTTQFDQNVDFNSGENIEDEFLQKGVLIVPDFVANAGGVISSYVEYIGGDEKKMFKLVEEKVVNNTRKVLEDALNKVCKPRDSALLIAKDRVLKKCDICKVV